MSDAKRKAAATKAKPKTAAKAKPKSTRKPKSTPEKPKTVLVLRTCDKDLRSYGGFQWPESGPVEAPDWNKEPHCGNGLHALLWGEGRGDLLSWDVDAKWLVAEVPADQLVDLNGKVKFPRGIVVHCGDRLSATTFLAENGAAGRAIVGGTATAGDGGTATAGYCGTATAGYRGTLEIKWYDLAANRYRKTVAYVGENGIKPNTPYRVNEKGEFYEAKKGGK